MSATERANRASALQKERDTLAASLHQSNKELRVQKAACAELTLELYKHKVAHKNQSEAMAALAAAYRRETGKAFNLRERSDSSAYSVAPPPSASSVGGFDVGDDESVE